MEQEYCPKVLPDFKYYKGEGTIDDNPFNYSNLYSIKNEIPSFYNFSKISKYDKN